MMDSIEKYNIELNLWIQIDLKMPSQMSDQISFSLNNEYLVILGGAKVGNTEFPIVNKSVNLLRIKPKKHSKR